MGNSAAKFAIGAYDSQAGTTFVVTGANAGLGFECVRMLAKQNGRVIMACRTVSKGEAAAAKVREETPQANVAVMQLDVSDIESINSFVEAFVEKEVPNCENLVLVNNAGVMALDPLKRTKDGREMQWATNCDGVFLLTAKLFPSLKSKSNPRVVIVSSVGHKNPEKEKFIMEDVDCKTKEYKRFDVYGSTKLGDNLFALGLTKRLEEAGITHLKCIACHPGFTATNIQSNAGIGFSTKIAQKAEYGAQTLYMAAVDPALVSGDYVAPQFKEFKGRPKSGGVYSKLAQSTILQDKFWELECGRLGLAGDWHMAGGTGAAAAAKTAAPTGADMEKAKLLYVTLKMDYTTNPDVPNVDSLKYALSEGGLTKTWAALPGLRHKYFIYDHKEEECKGVYVFYTEQALTDYMASDLFKAQSTYPHVSKVTAEVKDVMPGTELAIEKTSWAHTPPTRDDVSVAKMLVVDITMDFTTGVEGLPTKKEELYGFMAAPPNGMGYPAQFGELEGLRGKYFAYDASIDHCYGFYTFVNQASLDKYMASDLFKKQGEPPHIKALTYKVHDVLPGTEASIDLGEWGSN